MNEQGLPMVSVVIPTYNRAALLHRCLEALLRQDYAGPWEVIIVDDGSTDETAAVVESFVGRGPLRSLRSEHRGPAAARNRGIAAAQGSIIAFTDDDCLVPSDWLSRLVQGYARYPQAVGVGGYLEAPAETLRTNPIAQFERSVGREEYGAGNEEVLAGFPCPAGGTNNMSYRRQVLVEVSGFDESFPYAAGEDTDIKWRICQTGAQLLYIPVKVTHLRAYTWEAFRRQYRTRGRGVVHFERKYLGRPPSRRRILLRLLKRAALLPWEWMTPTRRPLAWVRFQARWFDALGQWEELGRLRDLEKGKHDDRA